MQTFPHSTDCHIHIFDSRYPPARGATLRPPDASVADYRRLQARIGTTRVVVVTPSTYGTDNRPMLDALAAFGEARGVAVVAPQASFQELQRMHAAGVRGVRLNLLHGDSAVLAGMEALCHRVAGLGWHLQLLGPAQLWPSLLPRLRALPVQVVFDHFGNVPAQVGRADPAFGVITALMQEGRAWMKLSGPMNISQSGGPGYGDVAPLARGVLAAAPRRVVWGTDWPHPALAVKPDDVEAMRLLPQWCDHDAALLANVLVGNPARLYGFDDA